jgi:hypothetical protein
MPSVPAVPAEQSSRRLILERGVAVAVGLSPLAVAVIAGMFAATFSRRAASVELLKLSVAILETPPNDPTRALRGWAVANLVRYSEVPVSVELQRALTDSLRLPVASISESGLVTALNRGTAHIVACSAGLCDTVPIVVTGAPQGFGHSPSSSWWSDNLESHTLALQSFRRPTKRAAGAELSA